MTENAHVPEIRFDVPYNIPQAPAETMTDILESEQSSISPIPVSSSSQSPVIPTVTETERPNATNTSRGKHPMLTRSKAKAQSTPPNLSALTTVMSEHEREPQTYSQAVKSEKWISAMKEEYDALMAQQTWTLVPATHNQSVVGCKWVYKIKYNTDGTVSRYKARLVAKGFHQTEGIDYFETFSPVAKHPTVRVVLSIALHNAWSVKQLDVSNAFLHGHLEEEVFMEQPKGFEDPEHPEHLCKLNKSLYGLKQAPRAWFSTFSTFLLSQGFTNSMADSSLFVRLHNNEIIVLLVYVDDILLTGNSDEGMNELVHSMKQAFTMKDLGFPHLFLGIQISKCSEGWLLNQGHYAAQLVEKAVLSDCKTCSTPMVVHQASETEDQPFADPALFRSLAGSLLYLTLTRPDISYAVNWVCQFMHTPLISHFLALKRILRYLSGCLHEGLLLRPGNLNITGYSDSDWAGDRMDRKSTTGYCIFLGENLIAWCAKKQPTIARSSSEAEYKALANATAEVMWLTQLLKDLHSLSTAIPLLWCDNLSAIALANNPVFHARTKHVEVDYHFIREKLQNKQIAVDYIPTEHQLADIFTKPLNSPQFLNLKGQLPLLVFQTRCIPEGYHLEGGCENSKNFSNKSLGQLQQQGTSAALISAHGCVLGPHDSAKFNTAKATKPSLVQKTGSLEYRPITSAQSSGNSPEPGSKTEQPKVLAQLEGDTAKSGEEADLEDSKMLENDYPREDLHCDVNLPLVEQGEEKKV